MSAIRMSERAAAAGYSLLELMTVIAILGILAGVALPSFGYLTANIKLKSSTTDLYLALLKARSEAVKRSAAVTVARSSSNWQDGWAITTPDPADATKTLTLLTQDALKGVTVTTSVASLVYLSTGRIQGTAPSFTVSPVGRSASQVSARCVSLQANGNPYVKESAC